MKTDAEIQKDVIEELKWQPSLNASEIGVAVKNGAVTLSGTVDSYLKKTMAEKSALRVGGVKAVAEDIQVKYPEDLVRNDSEIAQAILNALKWHSEVNEERIKAKVDNGVVTLEGEVDWEFQRRSAVLQIETLLGIKKIINNIEVKKGLPGGELKEKIVSAFHRSATVDADNIRVETSGNKVTLKGKVRSWAEKRDAENAVWGASGVNKVENLLEIDSEILVR